MAKINKTQQKIKANLLDSAPGSTFIKKDTIYFIDYGRLNLIRIFINKYQENITALGYELSDTNTIYYQHLFDRYPDYHKKLKSFLNS